MENQIKLFKNEKLNLQINTIMNQDGSISVSAEDTAKGFGWTKTETKNGREYTSVRWKRMNDFLQEVGFRPQVGEGDFIPESAFYMLGMKANNKLAQEFQKWLAFDVIPSIRKHGAYITEELLQDNDRLNDVIAELQMENSLKESKIKELEEVRTEYMKQRDKIIRIQIKCGNTKEKGRFIPYCILQLVREFIKDAENVEYRDDEIIKVDSRKLIRFVKGLFPKNHDAQSYLSQCLDIKVWEDVSVIPTNILEDDYEPIQDILY